MSPLLHGLVVAALLVGTAAAGAYPAPDPVTIPIDANLKFASGSVESIDEARHLLVVRCPAGLVTFHIDRLAVIGPDRRPRALADVRPGQKVAVWYHVDDGAIALELDL